MKAVMMPQLCSPQLPQIKNQQHSQPALYQQIAAQATTANISFTTKEGDRVNLSHLAKTTNTQIQETNRTNGLLTQTAQAATANGFSIEVEGDLNEQELADLAFLLDSLSAIADNFFQGNMDAAVQGAMNIGDMGTIVELDARFTQTTVLAGYLSEPHPLPAIDASLLAEFPDHRLEEKETYSITDALRAQWRQFLDSLNTVGAQERPEEKERTAPPPPDTTEPERNSRQAGKALFAQSLDTLEKNPRLTPLIPSVAALSLQKALSVQNDSSMGRELFDEVMSAFHDSFNTWAA